MAEHEFGTMEIQQSENAWHYFVKFWKYFFAIVIVGLIFLAIVGT